MNQRGFSLIEAVVVMLLLGILAGGALGFLDFNSRQAREGTASALMHTYADGIFEQMGYDARRSDAILDDGSGETFVNLGTYLTDRNATRIMLYDQAGTVLAGYWLNGGTLQEWDTGASTWQDYTIGNEAVRYAAGSTFFLPSGRRELTADLILTRTSHGVTDALTMQGVTFSCRN